MSLAANTVNESGKTLTKF